MISSKYFKMAAAAIFLFATLTAVASAARQPQLKKGEVNIGVVNLTTDPSYSFTGGQYRSFYPSYRAALEQIGKDNEVNFVFYPVTVGLDSAGFATRELIRSGVEGIVFFQQTAGIARPYVREARAAGTPVVVHGMEPSTTTRVPYVGFADYQDSVALGKSVATRLRAETPSRTAKVLILSSRVGPMNLSRAKGFITGFRSVVPDADFLTKPVDVVDPETVQDAVFVALSREPGISAIFATDDTVAFTALNALRMYGGAKAQHRILASVGGTPAAMRELVDQNVVWKAEEALSVRKAARETYNEMMRLVGGQIASRSNRILVDSLILVDPSRQQVQHYLARNFGVQVATGALSSSQATEPLAQRGGSTAQD